MGGAELQGRKAIERALENQMGEGNRGFERIADDVGQQAVALETLLEVRNTLRVEKHQDAEFLSFGPEGVELGIGQLLAVDASPDGDPAQPQALDAVFELL